MRVWGVVENSVIMWKDEHSEDSEKTGERITSGIRWFKLYNGTLPISNIGIHLLMVLLEESEPLGFYL